MSSSVKLGADTATAKEVWLSSDARRLSTYLIGVQGMGKTNLLTHIVLSDIKNGDGVCVLSPHPDLTRDVLKRIPENRRYDVIVFNPVDASPIGLNVFEWSEDSGVPRGKIVDDVVTGMFRRLWGERSWGPQMEQMLNNIAETILFCQTLPVQYRPTMAEFNEIIGDLTKDGKHPESTAYRNFLMSHIRKNYKTKASHSVLRFWEEFDDKNAREKRDYASSTANKAEPYGRNEFLYGVLGQTQNKMNLREVMDQGKVLMVDLDVGKLGKDNVELIGSLVVGRLLTEALGREKGGAQKQFHIIADEFTYFASPAFAELQDQARGFGVDVLIAHQRRGQLDVATMSSTKSARNWIVLSVNDDDAEELSGAFDSTPPEPETGGEREPLGYASYPWNALKRQAHDLSEVVDLVYSIDHYLIPNKVWDAGDWSWLMDQLELSSIPESDKDIVGLYVHGYIDSEHTATLEFEKRLNRLLYLMMTGTSADDVLLDMLQLSNLIFPDRPSCPPQIADLGDDALELLLREIKFQKKSGSLFWWRGHKVRGKIRCFVLLATRRRFVRWIARLGELLKEYPVWMRGGQPVKEPVRARAYADVTHEWKNRFAHLPQYEAWVRVQEGREIGEYHIQTIKIDDPPKDGDAVADYLREKSRLTYGVPREEIEEMLKARLDAPWIDSDVDQPPTSDPVE